MWFIIWLKFEIKFIIALFDIFVETHSNTPILSFYKPLDVKILFTMSIAIYTNTLWTS